MSSALFEVLPAEFEFYLRWSGILTLASFVLAVLGFAFGWGIRFRLVGVTGFLAVLCAGIFGLSLGLFERVEVPGALRYAVVFDNGGDRVVVKADPPFSESQLAATLKKAGLELFSYGRLGRSPEMVVRLRTVLHPEPGVSEPLYLGEVRRSLVQREDDNMEITIFSDRLARLNPVAAES